MLRIAFCDDDIYYIESMRKLIEEELNRMNLDYDIEVFDNGKSLLDDYNKEESFDLIFLDIDMKQMDGIALAEKIRQIDEQVVLIFLTMMEDRVYDTFGYNIYRFIDKKLDLENKKKIFRECIKRAESLKSSYLFNTEEGKFKVRECEIIYFERLLRKFYMMTTKGKYRIILDSFEQLRAIIGDTYYFQMISRSTLVNLRFVDEITRDNEVIIRYGMEKEKFIVSRGKKKVFYEKFINFME